MRFKCIPLIALMPTWLALAPASWATTSPDQLISSLTQELYELIDTNRESYQEDAALLRQNVDQRMRQHVDTRYASQLVLGRHGRGLSSEQIDAFADALGAMLMNQYADRLLDFDSQNTVEVLPFEPNQDPRRTRVRTRLTLDNGSVMPVDYVLRLKNDQWLVFDVIAEGISYVATFRTQIGEQISQLGFEATLTALQENQLILETEQP